MDSDENSFNLSEISDNEINSSSQSQDNLWNHVVKLKKTRDKLEKYVEITEIFNEARTTKKRKNNEENDENSQEQVAKYRFRCKICKQERVGVAGKSANIRSHLAVSKLKFNPN